LLSSTITLLVEVQRSPTLAIVVLLSSILHLNELFFNLGQFELAFF
jgi:hypothetical protein